jgi:hypothetical protein
MDVQTAIRTIKDLLNEEDLQQGEVILVYNETGGTGDEMRKARIKILIDVEWVAPE